MFKEIFLGKEKFFTTNVILFHVVLILLSFAFVYIFSYSTSFRYCLFGADSSVFQVMGKCWLEGAVPYKDLFDHKGSIVYVINALGYAIYPRSGIMVPQIICLYVSCLFVWRAMELYSQRGKIFFMLLTLIYYAAHYQEGNHVEEYSVLFLAASAYCFLRSLKENNFPPLYGFIYGLGFGACFLIRLSDAAQICCQTFLVAIFLIRDREFKTLAKNILNFCASFVIIVLPFVIYFAAHDALYEFFFGTLMFNLKYTTIPLQQFPTSTLAIYYGVHFMPFFVLIAASLLKILSDGKSRTAWSGLICGAAILFMLTRFRLFRHYCMIFLPLTPLLFAVFAELVPIVKSWFCRKKTFQQKLIKDVFVALAAGGALYFGACQKMYVEPFAMYFDTLGVAEIQKQDLLGELFLRPEKVEADYEFNVDENFSAVKDLASLIPAAEKNSVVTWGECCTMPYWILETNIKPRERLFFLNDFFGNIDPAWREEWFGNVTRKPPLWILYGVTYKKNSDGEFEALNPDDELEQLLAEKYSLKGKTYLFPQVMKLYRLKE